MDFLYSQNVLNTDRVHFDPLRLGTREAAMTSSDRGRTQATQGWDILCLTHDDRLSEPGRQGELELPGDKSSRRRHDAFLHIQETFHFPECASIFANWSNTSSEQ